jgi:hypothetical protein
LQLRVLRAPKHLLDLLLTREPVHFLMGVLDLGHVDPEQANYYLRVLLSEVEALAEKGLD